jgi:hypothetical protein
LARYQALDDLDPGHGGRTPKPFPVYAGQLDDVPDIVEILAQATSPWQ